MIVTILSIMKFTSSSIRHALMMVMAIRMVDGTASPDNFFFAFDKDLHTFGMRQQFRDKNSGGGVKDKSIKMTTDAANIEDDFDKAEEEIFHRVEDAERVVLDAAGDLMRDEVNVIFGNIKKHDDEGQDAWKMTSNMNANNKNKNSSGVKDKSIKMKTDAAHIKDDYDKAEEEIFHRVEDAERAVLGVAGAFVRDEVNALFGDIEKHYDEGQDARKMTSNGKAIMNANNRSIASNKIKEESKGQVDNNLIMNILQTMETYGDHCYE